MLDDDDQLSMIAFNYGSDIVVSVHSTAVAKISLLHVEVDFKELKNAVSGEEYAPTVESNQYSVVDTVHFRTFPFLGSIFDLGTPAIWECCNTSFLVNNVSDSLKLRDSIYN